MGRTTAVGKYESAFVRWLGAGHSFAFWKPIGFLLAAELIVYLLGLLAGAVGIACKFGWQYAMLSPLVFIMLHFAYGLGSIWGVIRLVVFRGWMMKKAKDARLSR